MTLGADALEVLEQLRPVRDRGLHVALTRRRGLPGRLHQVVDRPHLTSERGDGLGVGVGATGVWCRAGSRRLRRVGAAANTSAATPAPANSTTVTTMAAIVPPDQRSPRERDGRRGRRWRSAGRGAAGAAGAGGAGAPVVEARRHAVAGNSASEPTCPPAAWTRSALYVKSPAAPGRAPAVHGRRARVRPRRRRRRRRTGVAGDGGAASVGHRGDVWAAVARACRRGSRPRARPRSPHCRTRRRTRPVGSSDAQREQAFMPADSRASSDRSRTARSACSGGGRRAAG